MGETNVLPSSSCASRNLTSGRRPVCSTKGDVRHRRSRGSLVREILSCEVRHEIRRVIRGLRLFGTTRGLTGKRGKDLARLCGNREKNADQTRCDEYLRRGSLTASGVIEGVCRHLVKDRIRA